MAYFILDSTTQQRFVSEYSNKLRTTDNPESAEGIIVFGGDGAMLNAINRYHGLGIPFIGVHAGTRGFLMNNTQAPEHFYQHFSELQYIDLWMLQALVETEKGVSNVYAFNDVWMLQALVETEKGVSNVYAFNDVWVERQHSQTLRMKLTVDGVPQPPLIVGDGILFSTPQGSTGYNLSLRGKAIAPGVPVIQVTPMSSVVNKTPLGSIILSDSSEIIVEFMQVEKRPGELYFDGFRQADDPVKKLTVRKSDTTVQLGFAAEYSFFNKMLSWQLNF